MIFGAPTTVRKTLTTLLLSVVLGGVFLMVSPTPLYAQTAETQDPYYDGPSFDELFEKYAERCAKEVLIELIISAIASMASGSVPTNDWATNMKEAIGDCFVSATKNALLELITGQAVGWAQKGYGGNPGWVSNIGQFLANVADQAAGAYIDQTTAGDFLCSPFRLDIQLALTQYHRASSGRGFGVGQQSSCTLSGITDNIQGFLDGDFYAGGWDAWIEMSANPYNTPYGSYLALSGGLEQAVKAKKSEAGTKLGFASGYLSKEVQQCYGYDASGNRTPIDDSEIGGGEYESYECDEPQTVTPGATIKANLERTFGAKLDSIIEADEINEIIDLVAAYLLTEALTDEGGLSGYDYAAQFDQPLLDDTWGDTIDDLPQGGGGGQCTPTSPTPGRSGSPITHTPNPVTTVLGANIPLPSGKQWGAYESVTATFDVTIGDWGNEGDQYNIFWLNRGGEAWGGGANRVIELTAVRRGNNNVNLRATTQVDSCDKGQKSAEIPLQTGQTYSFTVDYEPNEGRVTITVHQANGNQIFRTVLVPPGVQENPPITFLSSTNADNQTGYYLQLGAAGSVQGNEGRTEGWRWSKINIWFNPL